jgi:hypothetical protein
MDGGAVNTLTVIALAASVGLNAVLLLNAAKARKRSAHVHKWTPWSDWRTLEGERSRTLVTFLRVRYCDTCALEEKQHVGQHYCDNLSLIVPSKERHCTHRALYTEIFDPMYELRQVNKDLEELQ